MYSFLQVFLAYIALVAAQPLDKGNIPSTTQLSKEPRSGSFFSYFPSPQAQDRNINLVQFEDPKSVGYPNYDAYPQGPYYRPSHYYPNYSGNSDALESYKTLVFRPVFHYKMATTHDNRFHHGYFHSNSYEEVPEKKKRSLTWQDYYENAEFQHVP